MYAANQWVIRRGYIAVDPVNRLPCDMFTTPSAWLSADQAREIAGSDSNSCDGIAFVLMPTDPYFFIDLDNCRMPNGALTEFGATILGMFAGARIEVSRSGTGLHIYGRCAKPIDHRCKQKGLNLELYTRHKVVNVTESMACGDSETDHTQAVKWIVDNYLQPIEKSNDPEWTSGPVDGYDGPVDDGPLLAMAIGSRGVSQKFDGKASFADLFAANSEVLEKTYPSTNGFDPYDRSSADQALAQHLAFWTGKDHERIERIMRMSALVRPKWESRGDYYLPRTIMNACSMCTEVFKSREVAPSSPQLPVTAHLPVTALLSQEEQSTEPTVVPVEHQLLGEIHDVSVSRNGYQLMMPTHQLEFFKGCVYITSENVIITPRGMKLSNAKFRAQYGGYDFALDSDAEIMSRNAWEAFTESRAISWPKVDHSAFRPDLPPCQLFTLDGHTYVNDYIAIQTPRQVGDVTPFLTHVSKVLPDSRDQLILISYMAACIQHKGVKFQWCPLVQGVQGNGKTLFTKILIYALGRRYCHTAKTSELNNNFNAYLRRALLVVVNEIYISEGRNDIMESFKETISESFQQVTMKGVDSESSDVCANYFLLSNHRDGLRVDVNDRRWCVFFSAQQTVHDLQRDHMDGSYFPDLWDWLNTGGYACVNEFLSTFQIPDEFNPAKLPRAPVTSTTSEVISASLGTVEQTVLEAVSECRPGFVGAWVSSIALDTLLSGLKRSVPPNKRRDMMRTLGYDYHPALKDGRATGPTPVDGGKRPRIYCVRGSDEWRTLHDSQAVMESYMQSQLSAVFDTPC